jgi:hypothetical protein
MYVNEYEEFGPPIRPHRHKVAAERDDVFAVTIALVRSLSDRGMDITESRADAVVDEAEIVVAAVNKRFEARMAEALKQDEAAYKKMEQQQKEFSAERQKELQEAMKKGIAPALGIALGIPIPGIGQGEGLIDTPPKSPFSEEELRKLREEDDDQSV